MLLITTNVNLPRDFCVIRRFQYVAWYIIVEVIEYIKNNKSLNPCGTPLTPFWAVIFNS